MVHASCIRCGQPWKVVRGRARLCSAPPEAGRAALVCGAAMGGVVHSGGRIPPNRSSARHISFRLHACRGRPATIRGRRGLRDILGKLSCGRLRMPRSRASGGIGRRAGFRCQCPKGRGGSTPPSRTNEKTPNEGPASGRLCLSHASVRVRSYSRAPARAAQHDLFDLAPDAGGEVEVARDLREAELRQHRDRCRVVRGGAGEQRALGLARDEQAQRLRSRRRAPTRGGRSSR